VAAVFLDKNDNLGLLTVFFNSVYRIEYKNENRFIFGTGIRLTLLSPYTLKTAYKFCERLANAQGTTDDNTGAVLK
jgi:hypothetical protein